MRLTKSHFSVISTERSEWRDLYNNLIINRYLDCALRASLDMTGFWGSLMTEAMVYRKRRTNIFVIPTEIFSSAFKTCTKT